MVLGGRIRRKIGQPGEREKIHSLTGGSHFGIATATKKSAVVGKFNFALIFIS
jgi:hypothetical protein